MNAEAVPNLASPQSPRYHTVLPLVYPALIYLTFRSPLEPFVEFCVDPSKTSTNITLVSGGRSDSHPEISYWQ